MRILNRPMFRYGGPIKEGVMHGMKNGGRAALVGNPVYPKTDGREHHFAVSGTIAGVAGLNALRHGAMRLGARYLPRIWNYLKPTSIPRNIVTKSKSTLPIGMRGPMGSRTTTVPRSNWQMSKEWMKANPGYTLTGALSAYNAPGTYGAVKGLAGAAGSAVKQVADLAVPDWIWDQDKWEKERALKKKPIEEDEISAEQAEILRLKKLLEDKRDVVVDPEAAKKLAKEKANERIQSYLDMMGYDSAKRGALDKALIDASALVQDATSEAGSLKEADWGKLINQAIQSTSKRLEKPEQIREAVGLMATKAAIEKDMEDPNTKKLRDLQIKVQEKALAGETLQDTINAAYQRTGEFASGAELAGLARTKGIDVERVFSTTEIPEDMSPINFITAQIAKAKSEGTPIPPGNYVIKDRLVEIDATGNVTPVV